MTRALRMTEEQYQQHSQRKREKAEDRSQTFAQCQVRPEAARDRLDTPERRG